MSTNWQEEQEEFKASSFALSLRATRCTHSRWKIGVNYRCDIIIIVYLISEISITSVISYKEWRRWYGLESAWIPTPLTERFECAQWDYFACGSRIMYSHRAISSTLEGSGGAITRTRQWKRADGPAGRPADRPCGSCGVQFRSALVVAELGCRRPCDLPARGDRGAGSDAKQVAAAAARQQRPAAVVRAVRRNTQARRSAARQPCGGAGRVARRPERAVVRTHRVMRSHHHPRAPSANLFGNARLRRAPDIGRRQGPSPPRWVPPAGPAPGCRDRSE